jgi:hypothetical protein
MLSMLVEIESLKDLTIDKATELIGKESNRGKIMGVDPHPPKRREGVWLVVSNPGEPIQYFCVG